MTTARGATTPSEPPLLRDRAVLGWLLARGTSDAGDALWVVALAWTAVQVAGPATAGLVVGASALPRALLMLAGGALADRHDVRRVLARVNAVRAVLLGATALAVALTAPSAAMLVVVAALTGACDAVHEPAAATVPRLLVAPDRLPAYAGLAQTTMRVATMLGTALGGLAVGAAGLATCAALNAITFVALALWAARGLPARFPLPRSDSAVLRGVGEAFAHLRREPDTRTLVATLAGLNLAVAPAMGLGLALRADDAGWGPAALGACGACVGAGAALGALSLLRVRPARPAAVGFAALVVQALAVVALGAGGLPRAIACSVIVGLTAGVASALLSGVFVATVDAAHLGRMSALQRLGDDALMPVAALGFGALAASAGTSMPFAVYGAAMALVVGAALARPRVRALGARPATGRAVAGPARSPAPARHR